MKNKVTIAVLGLFASCKVWGLDAGVHYVTQNVGFDEVSPSLQGMFAALYVGNDTPHYVGFYALSESSGGIDYRGIEVGTRTYFYQSGRLEPKFEWSLGYGHADVPSYRNDSELVSLGAGVGADLTLIPNVKVNAAFGYKLFFDATGEVECFDGYESDRVDAGACAEHGGAHYYQDKIGHGGGLYYRIGLRAAF